MMVCPALIEGKIATLASHSHSQPYGTTRERAYLYPLAAKIFTVELASDVRSRRLPS